MPDEIILVSRDDDHATNSAIKEIISESNKGPVVRNARVCEAGFLPPVRKAIEQAEGDVLVFLDDDAEAHPDWLQRIFSYYVDSSVAGVGGRYVNYFSGELQHYSPTNKVAKLSWFGRSVGNMYRDCMFEGAVDVDYLLGGNMSYRTRLLRSCLPDERIGNNVAFHWEKDVGLQVKRHGYRILFDPAIKVDHHTAPREIEGMRSVNWDGIYWSNYNYALLMRKHLSPFGFAAYCAYTFLIGGSGSPGLVSLLYSVFRGGRIRWRNEVLASVRGRIDGCSSG